LEIDIPLEGIYMFEAKDLSGAAGQMGSRGYFGCLDKSRNENVGLIGACVERGEGIYNVKTLHRPVYIYPAQSRYTTLLVRDSVRLFLPQSHHASHTDKTLYSMESASLHVEPEFCEVKNDLVWWESIKSANQERSHRVEE
jgi:hypothetical protein